MRRSRCCCFSLIGLFDDWQRRNWIRLHSRNRSPLSLFFFRCIIVSWHRHNDVRVSELNAIWKKKKNKEKNKKKQKKKLRTDDDWPREWTSTINRNNVQSISIQLCPRRSIFSNKFESPSQQQRWWWWRLSCQLSCRSFFASFNKHIDGQVNISITWCW